MCVIARLGRVTKVIEGSTLSIELFKLLYNISRYNGWLEAKFFSLKSFA